jgi:hypothetical protein
MAVLITLSGPRLNCLAGAARAQRSGFLHVGLPRL